MTSTEALNYCLGEASNRYKLNCLPFLNRISKNSVGLYFFWERNRWHYAFVIYITFNRRFPFYWNLTANFSETLTVSFGYFVTRDILSINGEEECDTSGNMPITYFAGNEWRHHYVTRQALALVHFRNLVDYGSETMHWRMPSPWICLSGCQLPENTSPMRNPEENAQQSHRIGGWHQLRVHWNGITNIGMVHVLSSSLSKFI